MIPVIKTNFEDSKNSIYELIHEYKEIQWDGETLKVNDNDEWKPYEKYDKK